MPELEKGSLAEEIATEILDLIAERIPELNPDKPDAALRSTQVRAAVEAAAVSLASLWTSLNSLDDRLQRIEAFLGPLP